MIFWRVTFNATASLAGEIDYDKTILPDMKTDAQDYNSRKMFRIFEK
jgi:hypothetical protein